MLPPEEPLNLESLRLGRSDNDMRYLRSRRRRTFFILIILLLVVGFGAWWVFTGTFFSPKVQLAPVIKMYPSQGVTLLNASGYVVAQRKASVSSKSTGRLILYGG